jgi:hypothetical protein
VKHPKSKENGKSEVIKERSQEVSTKMGIRRKEQEQK